MSAQQASEVSPLILENVVLALTHGGPVPEDEATGPAFALLRHRGYLRSMATPRGRYVCLNERGAEAAWRVQALRREPATFNHIAVTLCGAAGLLVFLAGRAAGLLP